MPDTLKKRADFLAVRNGRRSVAKRGFILQALDRGDNGPPRVGYTCSKKVGNAVARNRAKRRLREAARQVVPSHGRRGFDYVLIGRHGATAGMDFAELTAALEEALKSLEGPA